jgi:triacylglycerol lipase
MAFPILLAHGVARFDVVGNDVLHLDNNDDPKCDALHYFKSIRTVLKKAGFDVWHSNVPWASGVEERARALRKNVISVLEKTGSAKVNIIAHSMGGLDTRHMMFADKDAGKIHQRIAAVATISTPHSGSPVADWASKNLTQVVPTLAKIGIDGAALNDLTTTACRKFNADPDVTAFEKKCGVTVTTYAGQSNFFSVLGILKPFFLLIDVQQGHNDGLVSVESAKYRGRAHSGIWTGADHLNELGWWDLDQIASLENPDELLRRIHANYVRIASQFS